MRRPLKLAIAGLVSLLVVGFIAPQAARVYWPAARVIATTYTQGSSAIDLVVAIPRRADDDARNHGVGYGLDARVTYVTDNGAVESIVSGRVAIVDTTVVSHDNDTTWVLVPVALGAAPPPGGNPNFTPTVALLQPTVVDEPTATVSAITYSQGSSAIDVVAAIPRSADDDARNQGVDYGLQASVTYLTVLSSLETLDSGWLAIIDTVLLSTDDDTAWVLFRVALDDMPPPGGNPNFTANVQLLGPVAVDDDNDGIADTAPPTSKAECKRGGWASFNNPSFDDQRSCIRYANAGT